MSEKSDKKDDAEQKVVPKNVGRVQSAVRDTLDQTVDEYMPSVVEAIRGFVSKSGRFVDAEKAFTKFLPFISVAIGQLIPEGRSYTHLADNIRGRFFAEYRKQVKEGQGGKPEEVEATKARGSGGEQRDKTFTDSFITFMMLLPPEQMPNFLKAVDSLSPAAKREVRKSLGAIHHRQVQEVINRMTHGPLVGKFDENYWRDIMVTINKFTSDEQTGSKNQPLAEVFGEVQVLILDQETTSRDKILAFLKEQKNPEDYHRLILMLSKLGPEGLGKLAALELEDQKTILGLALSEEKEPDADWFNRQIEKFKKWRDDGRERDRATGQKLADQAVEVVKGDPRLSGIVPLFEGLAKIFQKN